jgi:hypothetical protein
MEFNCGDPSRTEGWHRWFAWCPVRVESNKCVWLETIERKGTYHYAPGCGEWWTYEYRRV